MSIKFGLLKLLDKQVHVSTYEAYGVADNQPLIIKVYTSAPFPINQVSNQINYLTLSSDQHNDHSSLNNPQLSMLADHISQQQYTLVDCVKFMCDLVEGIQVIHQTGAWHGQLQPAAILIDPVDCKAQYLQLGESFEQADTSHAITVYTAPEQTGLLKRPIDHRADFYALGAIFYQLVTGQPIYDVADQGELIYCHLTKLPISPHKVIAIVPPAISNLIMKLLAKDPDDRYHTSYGLKYDLQICLKQLLDQTEFVEFKLGEHDSGRFYLSDKLYGREEYIKIVEQAFVSNTLEIPAVVFIQGEAGVGKTVLLQALYKSWVISKNGHFILGHFTPTSKYVPYSAIIEATRDLLKQLLSENVQSLRIWRQKLLKALGVNANILCEIFPELQLIIGAQNIVDSMDDSGINNKFNETFANFITALIGPEKPLVLFLDDLQWVDSASIGLLEFLLVNARISNFIVVAAQTGELVSLDKIKAARVNLIEINLQPLSYEQMSAWFDDSFYRALDSPADIVALVYAKTNGNPFAINFYWQYLYKHKLLVYNTLSGTWKLQVSKNHLCVTCSNVEKLVRHIINKLTKPARTLLNLFACYGNEIAKDDLLILAGGEKNNQLLVQLVEAGLLQQIKEKLVFAGHQIWAAVIADIKPKEYTTNHLLVAQHLLKNMKLDVWKQLFCGVGHAGEAKIHISSKGEKHNFIKSNLLAGLKAKNVAAYDIAMNCFKACLEFVDKYTWGEHYKVCFEIYKNYGICAYFSGNIKESESLFTTALSYAQTDLEKVEIYVVQVAQYMSRFKHEQAHLVAAKGLTLCGIQFPESEDNMFEAIATQQKKIEVSLEKKAIRDLIHVPEMIDELKSISMQILFRRAVLCYVSNNLNMFTLCVLTGVNISLEYGKVDLSASMFAWYGVLLSSQGKYADAYEFGELAINMANEYEYCREKSQVYNIVAIFITNFRKHIRESIATLRKGYQIGFEAGDIQPAIYNFGNIMVEMFPKGDTLGECLKQAQQVKELADKYEVLSASDIASMYLLAITSLMQPKPTFNLKRIYFTEQQWQRIIASNSMPFLLHLKMQQKFWCNDYAAALAVAQNAEASLAYIANYIMSADHYFYYALSMLALYPAVSQVEQQAYLDKINACLDKLKLWSDNCPENFLHKYLLVQAEQARINGEIVSAINLYDSAISAAKKQQFIHIEALANELAAGFWLAQDKTDFFHLYLTRALPLYERWGCVVKVKFIENTYAQFSNATFVVSESNQGNISHQEHVANVQSNSETFFGHELKKLAQVAYAQRIVFLTVEDTQKLSVVSVLEADGNVSMLGAGAPPAESYEDFSSMVVYYVQRTQDLLHIDDATKNEQFGADPYIITHKIKAVLCLPIKIKGALKGLLYLENNLLAHAFDLESYTALEQQARVVFLSWEKYNHTLFQMDSDSKSIEEFVDSLRQECQSMAYAREDFVGELGRRIVGTLSDNETYDQKTESVDKIKMSGE